MSNISAFKHILAMNVYAVTTHSNIGVKLYLNEKSADIHFVAKLADGKDKRIPAHKLLLTTASDVFAAMFTEFWPEQNEVKIVDAPAAAFEEFLQFFYLSKVKLTMDNIDKVMYLGDKYNISECMNVCTKYLRQNLSYDNLFLAYELAIRFNQNCLKSFCELMIAIDTKAILSSNDFLQYDKEIIGYILKMNTLSCTEAELFDAVMAWVQIASKSLTLTKESVSTHIGDLFYEIRYRSMSFDDFAGLYPTYGHLYTFAENAEIIQMIAKKNVQPKLLNGNHRKPFKLNETNKVECSRKISSQWSSPRPYYIKQVEVTKFATNEPLLFSGFKYDRILYYKNNAYHSLAGTFAIKMTIVQTKLVDSATSTDEIVFQSLEIHQYEPMILLSTPILLKPGFLYEIRFNMLLDIEKCCTRVQMYPEIRLQPNIVVRFFDDTTAIDGRVLRGLIHSFTFYKV
ncbi:BTB/POZ domain-containing protein 3-like isoform X1 [Contarinia nasturtii]|uniref:BTB/POZ domain-containing protein 3-like isoform X1 n=1 Tax=Contarinia nasturtii TaxID=265458 RepID=UPI0012D41304|nr:BTB/POZ domain-containing protein 3-like isoform X1 [Contarinia nasturtii]